MSCRDVKVQDEATWRAGHGPHGKPTEEWAAVQPPAGYRLLEVRCPCGAKLTVTREADDDDV